MKRRTILALLVLLVGAFAFAAVGCGGDDDDGGAAGDTGAGDAGGAPSDLPDVTALPSASCTDIEYGGDNDEFGQGDLVPDETGASGKNETTSKQVLDPGVAQTAKDVLSTVVSSGTGTNAQTGDPLYRFNTGGPMGGGIVTYTAGGRQYIAAASGSPSDFWTLQNAGSPTIVVFGLPAR